MIQDSMTKRYEDAGVKIHRGYQGFEKIEKISDGPGDKKVLHATLGGKTLVFNELLWAVGRATETVTLDLDVPGVKTREKGYIVVDGFQVS